MFISRRLCVEKPLPMIKTSSSRSGASRRPISKRAEGSSVGIEIWRTGTSASGYMNRSGIQAPWSRPRPGSTVPPALRRDFGSKMFLRISISGLFNHVTPWYSVPDRKCSHNGNQCDDTDLQLSTGNSDSWSMQIPVLAPIKSEKLE